MTCRSSRVLIKRSVCTGPSKWLLAVHLFLLHIVFFKNLNDSIPRLDRTTILPSYFSSIQCLILCGPFSRHEGSAKETESICLKFSKCGCYRKSILRIGNPYSDFRSLKGTQNVIRIRVTNIHMTHYVKFHANDDSLFIAYVDCDFACVEYSRDFALNRFSHCLSPVVSSAEIFSYNSSTSSRTMSLQSSSELSAVASCQKTIPLSSASTTLYSSRDSFVRDDSMMRATLEILRYRETRRRNADRALGLTISLAAT